jgi:disulfide bond formation protein DsbB
MPSLTVFSDILAWLCLGSLVVLTVTGMSYFISRKSCLHVHSFSARTYIGMAAIVALFSVAMSLTYSNWYGLGICSLCYYQRMAMYPIALILSIAYLRKDSQIWIYTLPLTAFGFAVAAFHYAGHIQAFFLGETSKSILPCTAYGLIPSCTETYVISLGFMTIPLMAAIGFLLIGGCLFVASRSEK